MPRWTADQRLYLSEDGRVVDEAAPGRKTLLAALGATVPDETCRRYGLGPYAETEEAHRHSWRRDGTCRCGEAKPLADPDTVATPEPEPQPRPQLE